MSFFRIELFLILCVFCIWGHGTAPANMSNKLTHSTLCHRCSDNIFCKKLETYKRCYNKQYKGEKEIYHMKISKSNAKEINKNETLNREGLVSFKMVKNKLADKSEYESLANGTYTGQKDLISNRCTKKPLMEHHRDRSKRSPKKKCSPKQFDWRERGAVTAVKHQGACNACYAFSAAGVIEAQYFIKTGNLKSFSAQQIRDCSSSYGNQACVGGMPKYAFEYLRIKQKKLQTEVNYAYDSKASKCGYDAMGNKRAYKRSGAKVKSYKQILPVCEAKLKYTVATYGPVSVVVEIDDYFRNYTGGVFYREIPTEDPLHSLLLVGYGTDPYEGDYWILKNSWGTEWGESGYMRLARNKGNHRGIASRAYIAYLE